MSERKIWLNGKRELEKEERKREIRRHRGRMSERKI